MEAVVEMVRGVRGWEVMVTGVAGLEAVGEMVTGVAGWEVMVTGEAGWEAVREVRVTAGMDSVGRVMVGRVAVEVGLEGVGTEREEMVTGGVGMEVKVMAGMGSVGRVMVGRGLEVGLEGRGMEVVAAVVETAGKGWVTVEWATGMEREEEVREVALERGWEAGVTGGEGMGSGEERELAAVGQAAMEQGGGLCRVRICDNSWGKVRSRDEVKFLVSGWAPACSQ